MATVVGGGPAGCRIYLITPPALDPAPFAGLLAAALDAGDVAAVQLRLKDVEDDVWRRAIDALRPVCQSRGVAFLLNDRATAPMSARTICPPETLGGSWDRT
jgi:thiamine-phosphate pyrophosphorylase